MWLNSNEITIHEEKAGHFTEKKYIYLRVLTYVERTYWEVVAALHQSEEH